MINKKVLSIGLGLGFVITIGFAFKSIPSILIALAIVMGVWWLKKSINETTTKFKKPKRNAFGIKS